MAMVLCSSFFTFAFSSFYCGDLDTLYMLGLQAALLPWPFLHES